MNKHLLRLYTTPPELPNEVLPEATVKVQLGDLLPLVALASRGNYAWLQDFMDEEVVITADLHEILQAFRARLLGLFPVSGGDEVQQHYASAFDGVDGCAVPAELCEHLLERRAELGHGIDAVRRVGHQQHVSRG